MTCAYWNFYSSKQERLRVVAEKSLIADVLVFEKWKTLVMSKHSKFVLGIIYRQMSRNPAITGASWQSEINKILPHCSSQCICIRFVQTYTNEYHLIQIEIPGWKLHQQKHTLDQGNCEGTPISACLHSLPSRFEA